MRVLIADDDPINQRLMRMMLEQLGHSGEAVSNGEEVLELLRERSFDALLLDMHMPVLDGYGVLARLRNEPALRPTPVIAYTAGTGAGEEEKFLRAGCNAYLPKPVDQAVLAEKLESVRRR
jgi:CheY-like chemotaxis protein